MTDRRVLVVGNSISMSSATVPGYPERLGALASCWTVTTIIHSGATVEEMEGEVLGVLRTDRPHAFVLQVGINECAPRPLTVAERGRLGAVRSEWVRRRIIGAIHRWRPRIIRRRGVIQFTPPDRFASAVGRLVSGARAMGVAVLLLPITRVTAVAEARTPYTNQEVARYNDILDRFASDNSDNVTWIPEARLLPGLTPAEYCVTPDSVHLNDTAHQQVAAQVSGWLASLDGGGEGLHA